MAATERLIETNGVRLNVAIEGDGPAVVLCHGYPGLGYSWRHQMPALAAAGWRAIAPDQRGYGRSDRPADPAAYDADQVLADMTGLLDALGEREAVFVGHDFGAQLVCNLAVRVPERVRAVVVTACPYDFDLAGRGGGGSNPPPRNPNAPIPGAFAVPGVRPSEAFAAVAKHHFFHIHYFQQIGPAERELASNPREFLKRLFWALSGQGNLLDWSRYPSDGTGYLDVLAEAPPLPWSWLSQEEFDHYVAEFTRSDPDRYFIGGLNSYRVADRNWEIGARWADADIPRPTLFVAGADDVVLKMIPANAIDIMRARTPDLRGVVLVPGAGHFVQQEQPEAFNRALLDFLATLG